MYLVKNDKLYEIDVVTRDDGNYGLKVSERIFAVYNPFNKIGNLLQTQIEPGTFPEVAKHYEEVVEDLLSRGFESWEPTDWTSSYNFGVSISGYSGKWETRTDSPPDIVNT